MPSWMGVSRALQLDQCYKAVVLTQAPRAFITCASFSGAFAAGGTNNPLGLPVFLRFRMTSDAGTAIGSGGGWYVDNLVINN